MFKVEKRNNCKICGIKIERSSKYRTYCSKKCRNKQNNLKTKEYQKNWGRKKRAEYSPEKLQCIICGGWYVQIGTHVIQRHGFKTCKEYKEEFDFPLKKGIIPKWYKELKSEICKENKTFENVKNDKRFRYVKNDLRAKIISGWKGRRGNLGYLHNKYC